MDISISDNLEQNYHRHNDEFYLCSMLIRAMGPLEIDITTKFAIPHQDI
jgi:hypothetical protein